MSTDHPPTALSGGRRLDTGPLTAPVDRARLDAFIADSKVTGKPWKVMTTGQRRPGVGDLVSQLLPVAIPAIFLTFFVLMLGRQAVGSIWRSLTEASPVAPNLILLAVAGVFGIAAVGCVIRIVIIIRSLIVPRWWWEAAYRLVCFAGVNGLRYGHDETTGHPGVIFGTGGERTVERSLTTTAGRRVEIANYRYVERSDDHVRVYGWGYVAIQLDRRLPHLLLDAKQNNTSVFGIKATNLPVDLAADQRLTLGGEFDDKFTLYAPSDYGRDAFQIFAPDLMALFIDRLGTFDVEIVDDTMFCYGARFDLLDPATYAWLQELVETVVARTVRRTARYRDDFALLESDPGDRPPPLTGAATGPPAVSSPTTGFQLFPGFVLGPDGATGLQPAAAAPPPPASPDRGSVFAFAGDGPPEQATNTVATGGRRLRRRTWGLWSVVGLLFVAFWIYNTFLAPIFGWPHLADNN